MSFLQFAEKQYVEVLAEGITKIGTFVVQADEEYSEPTDIRVKFCIIGQLANQQARIYFAGGASDWVNLIDVHSSSRTWLGWINFPVTFDFVLIPSQPYTFNIQIANHADEDNPTIGLVRDYPFQVYSNKDGIHSINASVNAAQIYSKKGYKVWL